MNGNDEFGFVDVRDDEQVKKFRRYMVETYHQDPGVINTYLDRLVLHIRSVQDAGHQIGVREDQLEVHDQSKFSVYEFMPYAIHFCEQPAPDLFAGAWLHHLHVNEHHWQHWMFPDNFVPRNSNLVADGGVMEMPQNYALEMVADWMGAGFAYNGSWDMTGWLKDNFHKVILHPRTKAYVAEILTDLGYAAILVPKEM